MLVVAPLSGHHSTLLRDTVHSLLHDHKVFITDWTDARMVPVEAGPFHLDDYVDYVQEFIRHVGPRRARDLGVPAHRAGAGRRVADGQPRRNHAATMTMMGGPIDARKSPTAVNNLAMNKSHSWFENNVIYRVPQNFPGAGRRVYPGFLQYTGFVAMNPDRHVTSHYDYFLDLVRGDDDSAESHREFYDEYNAVLDMPAEYYLDTIKTRVPGLRAGQRHLGRATASRCGRRTSRHTALLTIEGELDDISGAGQTTRRARPVHRHPQRAPASTTTPRAPATTASSPAAAGARWSTPGARLHRRYDQRRPTTPAHLASAARQQGRAAKPSARRPPALGMTAR